MKKLFLLLLSSILIACSPSETDAEKVLKSFVQKRFSKELTPQDIEYFTTGEMAQELKNMSNEDFKIFAKKLNWKQKYFKIRTQNCKKKSCLIVYTIKYEELQSSKQKAFSTEVKKVAEIIKENNGQWKINKIENVKTYLKSHQEI